MGKAKARKRNLSTSGDPVIDELAVLDARSMFYGGLFSMGWRLAVMILLPIFVGVQLDKKFDSAPSLTLAAFFIAIFGACLMISKMYNDINAEQLLAEQKKSKKSKKLKRTNNA